MKTCVFLLIILSACLLLEFKQARANQQDYLLAKNAVRANDREFALMYFLSVLENDAQPGHREEALFATAEYYFFVADYVDTLRTLNKFLENYPHSKMRPYALFYLLKISQIWNNESLSKAIEKQIIDLKRIVLLFKDTQIDNFKSPFGLNYRLIYYIDKIEFYLDGRLQAQIFY